MNSERTGTALKKKLKLRPGWAKLGLAFLASNLVFFGLFSASGEGQEPQLPEKHVELGIEARLHTPFRTGKRVLIVNRQRTKKVEARLAGEENSTESRYLLFVREEDSFDLLGEENWEILPYLSGFKVRTPTREQQHEIRY